MKFEDPEDSAGARLFVYGTLRKGFRSHKLLQRFHARYLGTGYVFGELYDMGEYPGVVESSNDADRVYGELYFLPRAEAAFRILDGFEGFDPARPGFNLFERKKTTVTLVGRREVRAWIYCLARNQVSGRRMPKGNYAMRRL